jgi:hypothetical protein
MVPLCRKLHLHVWQKNEKLLEIPGKISNELHKYGLQLFFRLKRQAASPTPAPSYVTPEDYAVSMLIPRKTMIGGST